MYCMIPDPFPSTALGKGAATPNYSQHSLNIGLLSLLLLCLMVQVVGEGVDINVSSAGARQYIVGVLSKMCSRVEKQDL